MASWRHKAYNSEASGDTSFTGSTYTSVADEKTDNHLGRRPRTPPAARLRPAFSLRGTWYATTRGSGLVTTAKSHALRLSVSPLPALSNFHQVSDAGATPVRTTLDRAATRVARYHFRTQRAIRKPSTLCPTRPNGFPPADAQRHCGPARVALTAPMSFARGILTFTLLRTPPLRQTPPTLVSPERGWR